MLVVKLMTVLSRRTVPRFSQHAVSVLAEIWIYLLLMLPVMPCMLRCDRRPERSLFGLLPHPPLHNLGVKTSFGNRCRAGGNTRPHSGVIPWEWPIKSRHCLLFVAYE